MRVLGAVLSLVLALGAAGCSGEDPVTEIVVVVDSDLSVPSELDAVRIEVGGAGMDRTITGPLSGPDGRPLPRTLGLVHAGGPLGPIRVRAFGILGTTDVIDREARVSFVQDQTLMLRLNLLRDCVDLFDMCPTDRTCVGGVCESIDTPTLPPWTGVVPPIGSDGGMDGGMDGGDGGEGGDGGDGGDGQTCTPEVCNGLDDDCNSIVDDGIDTSADPLNCGSCGNACPARDNATPTCAASTCGFTCGAGFGDCDGMADTGCEAPLNTVTACSICGMACVVDHGVGNCDTGSCAVGSCNAGFDDCDVSPGNGCEADLGAAATCGNCSRVCSGGTPLCDGSGCISSCVLPEQQCGMSCVNTTNDVLHCGGCGTACPDEANSSPTCAARACGIACDPDFANCDSMMSTGCETSLLTTTDCGMCGRGCTRVNASASCATGTCELGTCDAGFGDCDGIPGNGCERPLNTLTSCGGCGVSCGRDHATATCASGMCQVGVCDSGFDDCNLMDPDGCETPLNTLTDCMICGGGCTRANATPICSTGACRIGMCDAGYGNCTGGDPDGCETQLTSLTDCGVCGGPCALTNATETCATGTCAIVTCDAGFGDCNTMPGDGCEANLMTDNNHCGSCPVVCTGGQSCVAGVCVASDPIVGVAAGSAFSCALHSSGSVECWGANASGELGDGTTTSHASPMSVGPLSSANELALGANHACARTGMTVQCWGANDQGQRGNGTTTPMPGPVPGVVSMLSNAVHVAAGYRHTCAIRSTGVVVCWGDNAFAQLGDNSTGPDRLLPFSVDLGNASSSPGFVSPVQVAAGRRHTCALMMGGGVYCWGDGTTGQMGNGTFATEDRPQDEVSTYADFRQIAAGDDFTCGVRAGAQVACWGANDHGQLGNPAIVSMVRTTPTLVSGITDALEVSAGADHACARRMGGQVVCWGRNANGEGGFGNMMTPIRTQMSNAVTDATRIEVGATHSCAATSGSNGVSCWGLNSSGQVGNDTVSPQLTPRPVTGLP